MSEISDRLKEARIAAKLPTAAAGAEFTGVKYPTYAGHENGSRGIKRLDAIRYARKYKIDLNWLLTGRTSPPTKAVGSIFVIGAVTAGGWLDIEDVEHQENDAMDTVPAAGDYPLEWQYAFDVSGTSINKVAVHGDRLICLDLEKSGMTLDAIEDGDLVVIEQTKHAGQMIRRTAKRIRKTTQGYDLWPDSDDPEHQQPIPMNGAGDGESVRVMAKVLWIMRRP